MKQIPLVAIRPQPKQQALPTLSSRLIRKYVKEMVEGLSERQAARDRRRATERAAETKLSTPTLFDLEEEPEGLPEEEPADV